MIAALVLGGSLKLGSGAGDGNIDTEHDAERRAARSRRGVMDVVITTFPVSSSELNWPTTYAIVSTVCN